MTFYLSSDVMARTTLNIDTPVLDELKRIQRQEAKSLGKLVSELLTDALGRRGREAREGAGFEWISKPMAARVDLSDKEALYAAMDRDE